MPIRNPDGSQAISVGTAQTADITIKDQYASQHHCIIERKDGRFYVIDLGSTNGTQIVRANGRVQRVLGRAELFEGDRIKVGRTILPWKA